MPARRSGGGHGRARDLMRAAKTRRVGGNPSLAASQPGGADSTEVAAHRGCRRQPPRRVQRLRRCSLGLHDCDPQRGGCKHQPVVATVADANRQRGPEPLHELELGPSLIRSLQDRQRAREPGERFRSAPERVAGEHVNVQVLGESVSSSAATPPSGSRREPGCRRSPAQGARAGACWSRE